VPRQDRRRETQVFTDLIFLSVKVSEVWGPRFLDFGSFLLLGAQDFFVFVSLCSLISGSQGHKDEETRGNQGRLFWAPRISIVFMWAANCKSEIAVKHSSITPECGNGMR
jgi:hypothetical protein